MISVIFMFLSLVASVSAQAGQASDKTAIKLDATQACCSAGSVTYPALSLRRSCASNNKALSLQTDAIIFPVITLSGGVNMAKVGESQSHRFKRPVKVAGKADIDTGFWHNVNRSSQSKGMFGLFIGAEYRLNPTLSWQAGISYNQSSAYTLRGNYQLDVNPKEPKNNKQSITSCSHRIESRYVLLENKFLLTAREKVKPYVLIALGIGFNKAACFEVLGPTNRLESRIALDEQRPIQYNNKISKNFVYKWGAGIDYELSKNWRIGVGYRYAHLGKADLGSGVALSSAATRGCSKPIKLPGSTGEQINSHELVAQVSYLFNISKG